MIVDVENLKVTGENEEKSLGVFVLEPLPTGFGATLGNALRRVLLTSIKGAAPTQVKIKGTTHPFTALKGVKEDVVEITLNLKKLRFRIHADTPIIAVIKKKGSGKVTAADIVVPSELEVMNKKQHIATLSDSKSEFEAEITVEPGVGYSPMEERESSKIGVIVLDALYSPVVKTSYEVEPTRFADRADLDKLTITIKTDGSIKPVDALKDSAKILKRYYETIMLGETPQDQLDDIEEIIPTTLGQQEEIAIDELPLQTRTINALRKHGVKTLKELAKMTEEEIADVKNLGEKSLTEIKKLLKKEGLRD